MYGEPLSISHMRLGIGHTVEPVAPVWCGKCADNCTPTSSCFALPPQPRCATICSIDGVELEDCAEIRFCKDSLVKLSFDECDNAICAELDICGLVMQDIVRGGTGIKVVKKNDAIRGCFYELSNSSTYSLNGVPFTGGYNGDADWYNLCLTSSDNSIEISQVIDDSCNGGYSVDLRSKAAGLGTSIIFKDLAALADFGCEVSNPGGPITIIMDGFDVECLSNSEVRLRRKFGSLGSVNNVKNNGGNIDLVSADKSVQIDPNDSSNTIDLKVAIRSTDSSKLSVTRDSDGTFVLDPSGGDTNVDWQNYEPVPTAGTTNPDFGAGSGATAKGQYKITPDKQVQTIVEITFGISAGVGAYSIPLPLPSASSALTTIGTFTYYDASGNISKLGWAQIAPNDTKMSLYDYDGVRVAHNAPITFAQGDKLTVNITYRSS